ncbi:hypothetical protein CGU36_28530, partial [Pseudomonas fluorescens]
MAVETFRLPLVWQEGQVEVVEGMVREVVGWVWVVPVGFVRGRWDRRPSRMWVSERDWEVEGLDRREAQILRGDSIVVSIVGWSFFSRWVLRGPLLE